MTNTMSITPACSSDTLPLSHTIIASPFPEENNLNFWHTQFGDVRQWVFLESQVFFWLGLWGKNYHGGQWDFHTLSNGGAFISPPDEDEPYHLFNAGNGNEVSLSAEAAGIAVCLMTWSQHSFKTQCEAIIDHYYHLRDYALQHPEATAIMHIID